MTDSWKSTLRSRGYRLTPQRQLVLESVTTLRHGTPDEICAHVQTTAGGVNISTVYRTLELLQDLGLVTHTHFDDGIAQYHLASAAPHQHVVCRRCGSEREIDVSVLDPLDRHLREQYDFQADLAHFAIVGTCGRCAAGDQPAHHHGAD